MGRERGAQSRERGGRSTAQNKARGETAAGFGISEGETKLLAGYFRRQAATASPTAPSSDQMAIVEGSGTSLMKL